MEFDDGIFLYGLSKLCLEILLGFKLTGLDEFINLVHLEVFELWVGVKTLLDENFDLIAFIDSGSSLVEFCDLFFVEGVQDCKIFFASVFPE